MTAPAIDRDRLAAVLGMLGSEHPGEVVNAARQAERLRREAGVTWREIVLPALPPPPPAEMSFAEAIRFVLACPEALTSWECDFLRSLRVQKYPLSDKQIAVLARLVDKAHRAPARAA
jgi:hypothetical protein